MKRLPVLLASILSSVTMMAPSTAIAAGPELKGNPAELRQFLHPRDNLVTLYGEAERTAYTDKAIVNLIVTTEKKKLAPSIEANRKLRETIRKTLTAKGVPAKDINSSKFSTSPQYGWFGEDPDSFKVVNRMNIAITGENHLTAIAALADKHEEIALSGTTFEHTKEDDFKEGVKQDALDKIMKQKKLYEKQLGVKLVTVSFHDMNIRQEATPGAHFLQNAMHDEEALYEVDAISFSSEPVAKKSRARKQSSPASFDEVKYNANLSVNFRVENGK